MNRAAAGDLVEQTAAKFKERASLVLVITPEGTRARVDNKWKSGFHRIARAAMSKQPERYGQG